MTSYGSRITNEEAAARLLNSDAAKDMLAHAEHNMAALDRATMSSTQTEIEVLAVAVARAAAELKAANAEQVLAESRRHSADDQVSKAAATLRLAKAALDGHIDDLARSNRYEPK